MKFTQEKLDNGHTLVTTSAGNKVEIRDHISAREGLELRRLKTRSFDMEGTFEDGQMIPQARFNHDASSDLELKALELYLISFNGTTEKVLDALLDGGTENCLNEVIDAVNEVSAAVKKESSES